MTILFNCPSCNHRLRAQDDAAGRKARCPNCGTIAGIPSASPAPQEQDGATAPYAPGAGAPASEAHAAPPAPQATRPCPYCAETIPATAADCPICGEFLEPPPGAPRIPRPRPQPVWPYTQPYDAFDIGTCISQGWAAAKEHYGIFVAVSFLVFVIGMAAGYVPFGGLLAVFLLTPHLSAGQFYVGIKAFRGFSPEIGDLFAGFRRYGVIVGVNFLVMLLYLACLIPGAVAVLGAVMISSAKGQGTLVAAVVIGSAGVSISFVAAAYVAARFFFVLPLAIDRADLDVLACLQQSSRLTEGRRFHLFLFALVLGFLTGATILLCFVGLFLVGYPLWMGAIGAAYCLLTREKSHLA